MQNLRPLQSHGDAVEKDEDQDHIVKELMGNNGLAEQSEPDKNEREAEEEGEGLIRKMYPCLSSNNRWLTPLLRFNTLYCLVMNVYNKQTTNIFIAKDNIRPTTVIPLVSHSAMSHNLLIHFLKVLSWGFTLRWNHSIHHHAPYRPMQPVLRDVSCCNWLQVRKAGNR